MCAAPVCSGPIKCIGINFPSVAQVKFRIVNRPGNGYSIRAYARTGEATKPAIKALTRHFVHEFRRSKDLLDQRIEYTRPPTRSANRSQIDLDARSGMVMLAGGDLERESDDCVVIEGPGAGDDPGDEEDPGRMRAIPGTSRIDRMSLWNALNLSPVRRAAQMLPWVAQCKQWLCIAPHTSTFLRNALKARR